MTFAGSAAMSIGDGIGRNTRKDTLSPAADQMGSSRTEKQSAEHAKREWRHLPCADTEQEAGNGPPTQARG